MFAACRDIARMDREVRAGTWTPHEGVQLLGKTLGVIGLGGIGSEVLRIGRGLGMEVIAWNRTPKPGAPLVPLEELLERSDVISMNLTLNDETRGFLGPAQFARMKPGVIFVNTARAGLVDEASFIAALRSGRIGHAGLDVFHAEPLKPDNPLAHMDNVTLTAHAAFRTLEASMTLLRRAIDIVRDIVSQYSALSHSGTIMSERFLDIALRVNGEDVHERVEARKDAGRFPARRSRPDRQPYRLRAGRVRRLHGAGRRRRGARLPRAGGAVRRRRGRDHRRHCRIPASSPICRTRSTGAMRCNAASAHPAC